MRDILRYDLRTTSLGELLVAASDRGVCWVRFDTHRKPLLGSMRREFPWAEFNREPLALRGWLDAIVDRIEGRAGGEVPLDVRGSQFQRRIWDALGRIPRGHTLSYGEIALAVGCPDGARAVGRACATNPVPILVPCHRAIRADGGLGGFLGGLDRKRALLDAEQRTTQPSSPVATPRTQAAVSTRGRPRVTTSVFS